MNYVTGSDSCYRNLIIKHEIVIVINPIQQRREKMITEMKQTTSVGLGISGC
jgi:hypothetical protein